MVLDTNVVVSALLFRRGALSWLRWAWQAACFVPLAGRRTTEELLKVLTYPKFQLDPADVQALLEEYLPWAEAVSPPAAGELPALPECRDPGDQIFLELAAHARADALVTGDRDLLVLARETPFAILEPAALRPLLDPPVDP